MIEIDEQVLLRQAYHTAMAAAMAGGRAALRIRLSPLTRTIKAPRDIVTGGDLAAQEAILTEIRGAFPSHGILSEEASAENGRPPFCWVVDPIDGTTNYYRGLPFYSISVALACEDELLVGAVYDPSRNEMFSGLHGGGAFLNGEAIHAAETEALGDCVFSLGLPYDVGDTCRMLDAGRQVIPLCACNRTLGSAALALSYIACGRLDAYLHPYLHPWDAAAGALILREAGGIMSDLEGRDWDFRTKECLGASPGVHAELLHRVRLALRPR